MIIPAAIFRISGFLKDDEIYDEPQEGGLVLAYNDKGKPVILELISNKPRTTVEDIKIFFENKQNSVIKEKEILAVSGELSFLESFEIELEEAVDEFKKTTTDRKAILDFKKSFTKEKAIEIVNERRRIKKGTIIKAVVDIPNEGFEKTTFRGVELIKIRSKSLIFQDNEPSTTGFYFYSQTENALPITISPVFNKDEPLGFFKTQLSKIATLNHFNFLIGHINRSVNKQINEKTAIYVPKINYDYEKIKSDNELLNIIKEIRTVSQDKEMTEDKAKSYLLNLEKLKEKINLNPKLIIYINLVFNIFMNKNDMKAILETKSNPMLNLTKSFVNLNFSKENPDKKEKLSGIIKNIIEEELKAEKECEINAIYHTPAIKIGEESNSWGFMLNNVQTESFVLSFDDTMKIYKSLKEAL